MMTAYELYKLRLDLAMLAEARAQRAAAWFGIGSPEHLAELARADAAWDEMDARYTYDCTYSHPLARYAPHPEETR
jgi:hypothetical protein